MRDHFFLCLCADGTHQKAEVAGARSSGMPEMLLARISAVVWFTICAYLRVNRETINKSRQ